MLPSTKEDIKTAGGKPRLFLYGRNRQISPCSPQKRPLQERREQQRR